MTPSRQRPVPAAANEGNSGVPLALGVGLGVGIGTAVGLMTGDLATWLAVGTAIGVGVPGIIQLFKSEDSQ